LSCFVRSKARIEQGGVAQQTERGFRNPQVPGANPGTPTFSMAGGLTAARSFLTHSIRKRESPLQGRSKMSSFQLISERDTMAKTTERLQVVLSLKTLAFLNVLSGKGTHGTSIPDAARTLIEQGIRRAIREGFLTQEEVRNVQRPNQST
jgi:hypothetical protein